MTRGGDSGGHHPVSVGLKAVVESVDGGHLVTGSRSRGVVDDKDDGSHDLRLTRLIGQSRRDSTKRKRFLSQ
jgi:hypothetical protein